MGRQDTSRDLAYARCAKTALHADIQRRCRLHDEPPYRGGVGRDQAGPLPAVCHTCRFRTRPTRPFSSTFTTPPSGRACTQGLGCCDTCLAAYVSCPLFFDEQARAARHLHLRPPRERPSQRAPRLAWICTSSGRSAIGGFHPTFVRAAVIDGGWTWDFRPA